MYKSFLKYIIGLTVLGMISCDTDSRSAIPDSPVYLERNLNLDALELRTIGGFKTYTTFERYGDAIGFGGLLIIYGFDLTYYAFDLACPNEVDRLIRVVPNDAGQAICSSCGSVFSIGYGTGNRISGPAKEGLRRYQVSVTSNTIRVTR